MRHRPIHHIAFALAVAALILTDGAAGQTRDKAEPQGFVQFPQIAGTSSVPSRKGWIEVTSLTSGFSSSAESSPGRLMMRKLVDKSSPLLMKAFKRGTLFRTVRLDLPDKGDSPEVYLKITLQNVRISEYRVDGQVEHITLTYEKIDRPRPPAPVAGPAR